jgi:hypothetical protein
MKDLTFDNDEEKCEGEAQQPHARAPTSHLRGCSRVGLRSSSLPSSELGSVIVLQSSVSTTISLCYRPPGFDWVGLYPYTVLDTRGRHSSCGLTSVLLIWRLTFFGPALASCFFSKSTQPLFTKVRGTAAASNLVQISVLLS